VLLPPTARHLSWLGHDSDCGKTLPLLPDSTQLRGPPEGSLDTSELPCSSRTTHSVAVGHETTASGRPSSTETACHALAPAAGLVELKISPERSTATHRAGEAQEIADKDAPTRSMLAGCQLVGPSNGSVDVNTSPSPSTAAHRAEPAQAMPIMDAGRGPPTLHVGSPAAGSMDVSM
jgi:hypothetical protein